MTRLQQLAAAIDSLIIEKLLADARSADRAKRAELRARAERLQRQLDAAVRDVLDRTALEASGRPPDLSGNPDARAMD